MINKKPKENKASTSSGGLKYHCPDHPDRPPFCAIGDYTPCRECYLKYRNQKSPAASAAGVPSAVILFFLVLSCFCFSAAISGSRITRHDPNIPCRQIATNYTSHPLYNSDCNELAFYVEQATGQPWTIEFSKYWLDCHPLNDPLPRLDVNFDGVTNLKDFALLSACRIYYKTKTGIKYHDGGCTYLRISKIAIQDPNGLFPCSVCIVAPAFLKDN